MFGENSQVWKLLSRPFTVLESYQMKALFVFLVGLLGSIFVVVYNPMGVGQYYINTTIGSVIPIQFAGVVGGLVLCLTQFILRPLLGFDRQNVGRFVLWSAFELAMISCATFIIYGEVGRPFWTELLLTTEKTFLLSIVPFVVAVLTVNMIQGKKSIKVTNEVPEPLTSLLPLYDEQGKVVLSMRVSDILYLQTEDNYVAVTFQNNEHMERKLIRNSLKNMEEMLRESPIKRIHRSYMINLKQISSIERKSGKIEIKLNAIEDKIFKISSSYKPQFENLINGSNQKPKADV